MLCHLVIYMCFGWSFRLFCLKVGCLVLNPVQLKLSKPLICRLDTRSHCHSNMCDYNSNLCFVLQLETVNKNLEAYYDAWDKFIKAWIVIKINDPSCVYQWRLQVGYHVNILP